MTELWDADSVGTWSGGTPATFSGFQREGSYCLGWVVSNTTVNAYQSFTSFDLTGDAIYMWLLPRGEMDTIANGGVGIIIGDGTNRRAYHVGGSDASTSFVVTGGWYCFMFDPANPPTSYSTLAGSAEPNFTAITQVGVRFKTLAKSLGNVENCFADITRRGWGLRIEGGTTGDRGTFAEIAADDESTSAAKAYGIIRTIQEGVYEVQGKLIFGDDGTGDSYFEDENAIIIFSDNGASDDLYEFTLEGNSTGTNLFKLGEKVGTGDTAQGRAGCTIMSAGPDLDVDLNDTNFGANVTIYGTKFYQTGLIELPANTSTEIIGCQFINCGQVTANQCILRACSWQGYTPDGDAALLWNSTINIEACTFIANTDGTNDPHAIEHPAAGTFDYEDLVFSGNDYDIHFTAASGDLVINKVGTSDPSTYEITGTGSVTINNPSVTTQITAKAGSDLSVIENVRVQLVAADATGDYPYQEAVTQITSATGTATVAHTTHGMATDDYVLIAGANEPEYNGLRKITVTGPSAYTYTVTGSPASPATGTITATWGMFNTLSNVSGIVTDTRILTADQPVVGKARKSTTSPLYKSQPITGTISASTGLTLDVLLTRDE